jgi:MFS family permease
VYPTSGVKKDTQKAMRLNTIEGAFAVAAENLAAPYLGLFALALGATPSQIGMLTAFPNLLGNILQIPAGLLAERMEDKRILPAVGGYLNRLTWVVMAIVPFLFPPEQRVGILILLATFRITAANLGVPAWTALQANLVPQSIRGKYYANRNVVLNTCALLATFGANRLLRLDFPLNYQIIFAIATVLGVTATYLFTRIPFDQPPLKPRTANDSYWLATKTFWADVKNHKDFLSYARSSLIWNFGVTLASSLFAVHFVDTMGGHAGSWAIFAAVNIATQILIQRYWGRLADIFGHKNVMSFSGIGAAAIPLLWWIAPTLWFPIVVNFVNGLAWGGYNLAAFNLLLEITPDENRSLYVGVYNTLMGFATAAGPLVGGFAAEIFGLKPIFLASAALRALGLYVFYRTVSNTSGREMGVSDLVPKRKSGKSSLEA